MKKSLILILVLGVVAVGGIVYFSSKSKSGGNIIQPTQPPVEEISGTEETMITEETTSTKESEANTSNELALGGSYKCTYTMEQGFKVTTYVKNGKMRTEIPLESGDTNISLYTDNKVYQWSAKEKQGIFMAIEEAKKQPGTEVQDPDKYLEEIKNKYKPDCQNMNLADSLFAVPKDIQFQDLSKALNN